MGDYQPGHCIYIVATLDYWHSLWMKGEPES